MKIHELIGGRYNIEILLNIASNGKPKYINQLSRDMGATYSHCSKLINRLSEFGLVNGTKRGRRVILSLTNKGKEVTYLILKLRRVLLDGKLE